MNMRDFENLYSGYDDMIYCSIGQPGYAVDTVILNTIIESLKNPYQKYPTKKGNQKLIEAIANKYNCSKSIVITHGASEALMMSLLSIFKSDGTLLIPSTSYPAYFSICKALGIKFKESL